MKRLIWKVVVAILVLVVGWLLIRSLIGGREDTWLCQGGQWVKHGNPAGVTPDTACLSK